MNLGPKTPMPTTQQEIQQDRNWPHRMDWPQIGEDLRNMSGNSKRTNGSTSRDPSSSLARRIGNGVVRVVRKAQPTSVSSTNRSFLSPKHL